MCPKILHIYGPLWINGYGLMIAAGFFLFTFLTYRHEWRKKLISGDAYLRVLLLGFLAAVIGGRLLFVLFNLPTSWQEAKEVFYLWEGGFSLFGSILAVIITVSVYLRASKIRILPFFDLLALYTPLLQTLSRIGCFLAGCCHGVMMHAKSWWSVTFTDPYGLAPRGVALHPTQLYSAGASLMIFLFLLVISKKASKIPGVILLTYLLAETTSRFVVDFWRGDRGPLTYLPPFGWALSSMQLIVAVLFMGVLLGLFLVIGNYLRGPGSEREG